MRIKKKKKMEPESKEGKIQKPVLPQNTLQLNNGQMFNTASSGSVYPEKQLHPFQSASPAKFLAADPREQ